MRCTRNRWLGICCLASIVILPSSASASNPNTGSWRKSCTEQTINAQGDWVQGNCKDGNIFNNQKLHTRLDHYSLCVGDIANDEGRLKCVRDPSVVFQIPDSAGMTCDDGYIFEGNLHASCKKKNGAVQNTSTSMKNGCKYTVNNDGALTCYATAAAAAPPAKPEIFHYCVHFNADKDPGEGTPIDLVAISWQAGQAHLLATYQPPGAWQVVQGPCR